MHVVVDPSTNLIGSTEVEPAPWRMPLRAGLKASFADMLYRKHRNDEVLACWIFLLRIARSLLKCTIFLVLVSGSLSF
jgi:hypothetical protein